MTSFNCFIQNLEFSFLPPDAARVDGTPHFRKRAGARRSAGDALADAVRRECSATNERRGGDDGRDVTDGQRQATEDAESGAASVRRDARQADASSRRGQQ